MEHAVIPRDPRRDHGYECKGRCEPRTHKPFSSNPKPVTRKQRPHGRDCQRRGFRKRGSSGKGSESKPCEARVRRFEMHGIEEGTGQQKSKKAGRPQPVRRKIYSVRIKPPSPRRPNRRSLAERSPRDKEYRNACDNGQQAIQRRSNNDGSRRVRSK